MWMRKKQTKKYLLHSIQIWKITYSTFGNLQMPMLPITPNKQFALKKKNFVLFEKGEAFFSLRLTQMRWIDTILKKKLTSIQWCLLHIRKLLLNGKKRRGIFFFANFKFFSLEAGERSRRQNGEKMKKIWKTR